MTAAEIRRVDLMHQEARNRALREVRSRLESVLVELNDQNYGLANRDVRHIIALLDDDNRTPQVVMDHLNMLEAQYQCRQKP